MIAACPCLLFQRETIALKKKKKKEKEDEESTRRQTEKQIEDDELRSTVVVGDSLAGCVTADADDGC